MRLLIGVILVFSVRAWSITEMEKSFYNENGYLILENFVSEQECDALKVRAEQIVEELAPAAIRETFSTKDNERPSDRFFLDSAATIRLFFEPKALQANVPIDKAINKMGHAMHDLDPVFTHFSHLPQIKELVNDLGLHNPLIMQSMYIFKPPLIGGDVTCHQDGTFLYTEPDTTIGLWFAVEDATLENGCLWAIPGGHAPPLKRRFVKSPSDKTSFIDYDTSAWDLSGRVSLEVKKGTVIVLHSRVPHMSEANTSSKSRHAYTLHIIDAASAYPSDNWLQLDNPKGF